MISSFSRRLFSTGARATAIKPGLSLIQQILGDYQYKDALLVANENLKWTVKELDAYTTAFAKHLVEMGYVPGQKLLVWSDVNHSAEIICATIGAWKAGLTVLNSEFENHEDIIKALNDTDVFVFSPFISSENKTRLESIQKELLATKKKHIIQISHKTIEGTIKFKQAFNYSTGLNSNLVLPELSDTSIAFEVLKGDNGKVTYNHKDIADLALQAASESGVKHGVILNSAPIFYPSNFTIGFLSHLKNNNYVVFPGSYSLKDIINVQKNQKAKQFVCEGNLLDISLPENKVNEISAATQSIESLIVIGEGSVLKEKNQEHLKKFFPNAKVELFDEFSMKRI